MPPKILYFDIGNVLMAFSHERMCQQMAEVAGISQQAMWDFLFQDTSPASIQWRYECGQIGTDQFFQCLCETMGVRPDRRRLEQAVCDIFEPIEAMSDVVHSLAARGHRLGILSNTNPLQWDYFTDGRFALLASPGGKSSPFSTVVLSYQAGAMKPDPRIFELAIERAGASAEEVFFVDDREENVTGAAAAGIDAVRFIGVDKLVEDLRARGAAGI
jgi:glucose-1-phosphatase